ncbi:MAG: hypothetical protein U1E61_10225 [Bradyrhizobium sp.]
MTAGAAWTTSPQDGDANASFAAQPTADDQNDISADQSAAAPETSAANGPVTLVGLNELADGGASSAGIDDALDGVAGSGIGNIAGLGQQGDGSGLELVGPNGALQSEAYDSDVAVGQAIGSEGLVQTIARAATLSSDPLQDAAGVIYAVGPGAIGATPSADGHSNLASDLLNLPGNILAGNLNDGLSHIGSDLADIADAAGVLVNGVLNGNDSLLPTSGILGDLGGGLQNVPILTTNGGNNGNGGLLGGTVGDFNGSSTGHLIDLDAGPQNDDGLALDVLATPDSGPGHTAAINAIDVGPNGPQLLDAGLATGDSPFATPALDGLGLQDLSGAQTGDLLTVNSGNNSSDGGLAGATIGDLNGSSNGHHLVDGDVGPSGNGNTIDVLAAPTGSSNTLNANAIDVGPNAPQLADVGVLTGADHLGIPGTGGSSGSNSLNIPALNGAGTDGLAGDLLGHGLIGGDVASGNSTSTPLTVPADVAALNDVVTAPLVADHGILDNHGTSIL